MSTNTSMGRLTYAKGMHLDVIESLEWESTTGDCFRAELWRDDGVMRFNAYRLNRGAWLPFIGNQETAMYKRKMMSLYGEVES